MEGLSGGSFWGYIVHENAKRVVFHRLLIELKKENLKLGTYVPRDAFYLDFGGGYGELDRARGISFY